MKVALAAQHSQNGMLPEGTQYGIIWQMNKPFVWDDAKNAWLIAERGISFAEIVFYIMNGHLVDVIPNQNQARYPGQRIFVVDCAGYIHLVPFEESEKEILLKTIIPSRKATKKYLEGGRDET